MDYIIAGIVIVVVIIMVIFKSKKEEMDSSYLTAKKAKIKNNINLDFFANKRMVLIVDDVVEDDTYYAIGVIDGGSINNGDIVSIVEQNGNIIERNVVVHGISKEVIVDGKPDIEFDVEAFAGDSVSVGLHCQCELKEGMVIIKD